jgi:diacylglycerol kinase (ATP)
VKIRGSNPASITAIINPAAGRGGAARAWANIRAHLREPVETLQTNAPGHASELTAQAIKRGADTIVAVGGDGTINEVVNGFFEQDELISDRAMLGIVPHGTGSDFIKMLSLPQDDQKAATIIEARRPFPMDLLKVRYTTVNGTSASRYSINITSFGMGAMVASRVNRSSKLFGRKLSYVLALMRTAMTFSGNSVSLSIDEATTIEAKVTSVAVGNGKCQGGGMLMCPRAVIDDGLLDVTLIKFLPLPDLIRNLPVLYNGDIYKHPKVQFMRVSRLRADSKEPVPVEIDGESVGRLPVEISIVPRVLRILFPPLPARSPSHD